MLLFLLDLLLGETSEAVSRLLIYGPPVAAAVIGLVAVVRPRALVLGRWLGLATAITGVGAVAALTIWESNYCYEEYASCGYLFPLFDAGWTFSVGVLAWVLVAGMASGIRALRTAR